MSLYCWEVLDDGQWNIIAACIPPLFTQPTPLMTTRLVTAHALGLAAVAHHDESGLPIRLAHYTEPMIIREVP